MVVTIITFVGLRVALPASVVDVIIGEYGRTDVELRERLEEEFGLSSSIPEQYAKWVGIAWFWGGDRGVLQGNLGESLHSGRTVVSELKRRVPVSFELGVWGQATAISFAV